MKKSGMGTGNLRGILMRVPPTSVRFICGTTANLNHIYYLISKNVRLWVICEINESVHHPQAQCYYSDVSERVIFRGQ